MANQNVKKIVIAGGGFGGVRAARKLARLTGVQVTLISDSDAFTYYPQLYHAATGGSRAESAIPLAELLAGTSVQIVTDSVTTVDHAKHRLTGASKATYEYDELILALGSVTNYFGIKGLEEFAYNIKSIDGAERFKRHLHTQLVDEKRPDAHYVVVGGGPTGIELAGALGEYLRRIMRLHGMATPKYTIELVEAAPRLLPRMPENQARKIQERLESLGVHVSTGTVVEAETATDLRLKGEEMQTKTVVWTAGVANNSFFKNNAKEFTLAKNGRVEVDVHMEAHPQLYVIGDNASTPFGGLAQTAIADADFVASDIARKLGGQPRPAYQQKPGVSVIPVGSHWAAVQWSSLQLYGLSGWILRRLADLAAYGDIESWPKALQVWGKDHYHEDDCPLCAKP
jgi:NADH dehydrogenase